MEEWMVILIVGIVFGSIAAIVILPFYFRERTRQSTNRLISEAIAKGQNLDPAIIERITQAGNAKQQSTPRRTLGNGLVLLSLGAAFAAIEWFSNHDFSGGLRWPAMILIALGISFTVLAIIDYLSQKKNDR